MLHNFQFDADKPVLVIGGAGVDIVGRLHNELLLGVSNPSKVRSSFGGVGRNVAENLARLGQSVTLLTAVGRDQMGEQLIDQLMDAGVDVSAVIESLHDPTGTYIAVHSKNRELALGLDDMRVISSLTPQYLQENYSLFKDACMLFVDTNLSKAAMRKAMSLANKASIPICADPTSILLTGRLKAHLERLFLITPNVTEAEILCNRKVDVTKDQQTLEAAKHLVSQGTDIAIITLAQFGVCYATSETSGFVPALNTEIVDPTGGGDAFTSAVIFGLVNEIPLDDAIRLGVSAASLTLRYPDTVVPGLSLELLYDQLVI